MHRILLDDVAIGPRVFLNEVLIIVRTYKYR